MSYDKSWDELKVGIYLNEFPKISETFIRDQILNLLQSGVQVHLITKILNTELNFPFEAYENLLVYRRDFRWKNRFDMFKTLIYLLITESRFRFFFYKSLIRYPIEIFNFKLIRTYLSLKNLNDLDLLHVQFATRLEEVIFLINTGLIPNCKIVVSCRGQDISVNLNSNPLFLVKYYDRVRYFLPVSHSLKAKLLSADCPSSRIEIIPSGIDIDKLLFRKIQKQNMNDPVRVLSVGRLVEKKGFLYSIRSIAEVIEKGYDLEYVIIGDGPQFQDLKSEIRKMHLEKSIVMKGQLKHDEVIEIMQKSNIFIMHYVTAADGDMEGIPNVIKEAMIIGLPIISTKHSGIKELEPLASNNLLVKEKDVDDMVAKIENTICLNSEKLDQLILTCREYVIKNFDASKINKKLLDLYRRACSTR